MDTLFEKVEMFDAPSTILFRSIELKLLQKTLKRYYKQGKRVLDLGCGEGIVGQIMFNKPIGYGLDTDKALLKRAKKRGIYKKVLLADARKIPLPDNSIDIIFSNSVVEHISNLHTVLKEVNRILKPGGLFIYTTISDQFAGYTVFRIPVLSQWWGKIRNKKFEHYHTYSLPIWKKLLRYHDFSFKEGYYYISPTTLRFWEFLLFLFYIPLRLNQYITQWLYSLVRKRIIRMYNNEKKHTNIGAALCIVAEK